PRSYRLRAAGADRLRRPDVSGGGTPAAPAAGPPGARTGVLEVPRDEVPAHDLEEVVAGAAAVVAVVDVVGVLPDVGREQRRLAVRQRGVGVVGADDLELAARVLHEPAPAAREVVQGLGLELLAELLEAPEGLVDGPGQRA